MALKCQFQEQAIPLVPAFTLQQAAEEVEEMQDGVTDFYEKYTLGEKLGRGAFAQVRTVMRAQASGNHPPRQLAVKILDLRSKTKPGEESMILQKAANKEVAVWRSIPAHPNCLRLHDVFWGDSFCYMVMDKCAMMLFPALETMPDHTERALGVVFAQMLCGIAHCHSVGVVHRDIKPDNFLVGGPEGQTVKLVDFGLSAVLPESGKVAGVFGTAPFMCPEMLSCQWYDEKSDVWSFAAIAYTFLCGMFPYMPKVQTAKGMKQAIMEGKTPNFTPVEYRGSGSYRSNDALEFVKAALIRDPQMRPSAEELLAMPWICNSLDCRHAVGEQLPSLRPMWHYARKLGAFEVRDFTKVTTEDVVLNNLQSKAQTEARESPKSRLAARRESMESVFTSTTATTACSSSDRRSTSKTTDSSHDDGISSPTSEEATSPGCQTRTCRSPGARTASSA